MNKEKKELFIKILKEIEFELNLDMYHTILVVEETEVG